MHALLLAAVLVLSPLDGLAGEKQIVDVKELAGRWRGWVNEVAGDEWSVMNVSPERKLQSFDTQWHDRREVLSSGRKGTVSLGTNDAFGHAICRGARGRERFRRQRQDPSHVDA
jgi:hypothetical protein